MKNRKEKERKKSWDQVFKGTVSLYSPGALLKIEIRHFDGPVFPYTLAHLVSIPHFI